MTFQPSMQAEIRGIHAREPLRFRAWQGVVADYWQARGTVGGGGYYTSPHPRIVLFPDQGSSALELSGDRARGSGLAALYVPAHVPITSRILHDGDFAHVDLHLQPEALDRRLAGLRLGRDPNRPQFLLQGQRLRPLAGLIADELTCPSRPEQMLEGLLIATLTEVFDARGDDPRAIEARPTVQRGGLTPFQMAAVKRCFHQAIDRHLSVAELARAAGLSESWFAHAFKLTTGQSPQRWQMQRRLALAARMIVTDPDRPLVQIAAATGFADQPHFSRAFRAEYGQPPAAWRRERHGAAVPDLSGPGFATG